MSDIPEHIRKQFEEAQAAYLHAQRMADARVEPERSKYEVMSEWVRWWWMYFKENTHYQAYCRARRVGDTFTCAQLEATFMKIAELYEDWGDIDQINKYGMGNWAWKAWFDDHRDLFLEREPEVTLVTPPISQIAVGNLLVQIPKGLTKQAILQLLVNFVEQTYPVAEAGVSFPPPKYQLYSPKGKLDKSTLGAVSKAYWVNDSVNPSYREPRSLAETALHIIDNEADFGFDRKKWKLGEIDRYRPRDNTFPMTALDPFRTQVIRLKKHYAAYVENTIHGVFPKKEME
jgi:hypothetical protein